jgi:hypothetical protein
VKLLDHKRVENGMKYINLFKLSFKDSESEIAGATAVEEARKLLAVGFKYVQTIPGIMLYRRPKRFSPAGSSFDKRESYTIRLK